MLEVGTSKQTVWSGMPIVMTHFNTGFSRSYVEGRLDVLDYVLPVIDAGEGEIPGIPGFFVRMHRFTNTFRAHPPDDGAAWFTIASEPGETTAPWIVAYACWRREDAAVAWRHAVALYDRIRPHLDRGAKDAPAVPPATVPWLAQMFTQHIRHLNPPLTPVNINGFLIAVTWALMEGAI